MAAVANDPRWELVLERLETGDAGRRRRGASRPARARPGRRLVPRPARDEIARNAGDPGLVLARRLSNAELNYTIRDLTGVDIRPTREFPVDPSNTAGFDNSGESLTMSPALLKKYLKAARDVANHMFLQPAGLRVRAAPDAVRHRSRQVLRASDHRLLPPAEHRLRRLLRARRGATSIAPRSAGRRATLAAVAAEAEVSAKYLATLWSVFEGTPETDRSAGHGAGDVAGAAGAGPAARATPPRRGRDALRDYIVHVRKKIEPRFLNIVAGDVNAAQQPFMIWKNVQYATHRMTFDAAQLQVEGEPRAAAVRGPGAGRSKRLRPRRDGAHHEHAWRSGPRRAGADSARATRRRSRGSAASSPTCSTCRSAGGNYFDTTQGSRPLSRRRLPQPDGLLPRRSAALRADPRREAAGRARRAVAGRWTSVAAVTRADVSAVHRESDDAGRRARQRARCHRTRPGASHLRGADQGRRSRVSRRGGRRAASRKPRAERHPRLLRLDQRATALDGGAPARRRAEAPRGAAWRSPVAPIDGRYGTRQQDDLRAYCRLASDGLDHEAAMRESSSAS